MNDNLKTLTPENLQEQVRNAVRGISIGDGVLYHGGMELWSRDWEQWVDRPIGKLPKGMTPEEVKALMVQTFVESIFGK